MPPAQVDLSGVYGKLDRAEKYIEVFRDRLSTFLEGDPKPFGFRTDKTPRPDKSVDYVVAAVVRGQPPFELALLIGDIVHNLHSALDHFAYVLSKPSAQKKGRTFFPIFTDECEFKVNGVRGIQTIEGDERTLIERVQPYAAFELTPDNSPLEILRKLSNLDKHQLPVPMIAAAKDGATWLAVDNAKIKWTHIEKGPVEDGTPVLVFTAIPEDPAAKMNVNPELALEIRVRGESVSKRSTWIAEMSAESLLGMIYEYVRWRVVGHWFEHGRMPPAREAHNPS
jgi:hypothetical protein